MGSVIVNNVHKSFMLGQSKEPTALERVLGPLLERETKRRIKALDGVSFSVGEGEVYGIIGRNGCGKSTLLRIVAGIYKSDIGSVTVRGRLIPLIHLDTAVKPRLTLRENVHLICALLGMDRPSILRHFDTIIDYAGLQEFTDAKWYTFSDGMKQKAVFAVGVHASPGVLLLDEAFSAGDESFRLKSLATVRRLAAGGTAVIMVGHNLESMNESCDRIAWIEDGRIAREGAPRQIVDAYLNSTHVS